MWGSGGGERGGQEMAEGRKRWKLDWESEKDVRVKKRWKKENGGHKNRERERERNRIRGCYMLQCSVRSHTSHIQEIKGKSVLFLCLISIFLAIILVSYDTVLTFNLLFILFEITSYTISCSRSEVSAPYTVLQKSELFRVHFLFSVTVHHGIE